MAPVGSLMDGERRGYDLFVDRCRPHCELEHPVASQRDGDAECTVVTDRGDHEGDHKRPDALRWQADRRVEFRDRHGLAQPTEHVEMELIPGPDPCRGDDGVDLDAEIVEALRERLGRSLLSRHCVNQQRCRGQYGKGDRDLSEHRSSETPSLHSSIGRSSVLLFEIDGYHS